jgi:hypothetical protein
MKLVLGMNSSAVVVQEVERTWYTRDLVFEDPLEEGSMIFIRTCPEDYTTFPPLDEVTLEFVLQRHKFNIIEPTPEECYEANPECVNSYTPCWPCRYIEWLDEWEDVPVQEASYALLPWFPNKNDVWGMATVAVVGLGSAAALWVGGVSACMGV